MLGAMVVRLQSTREMQKTNRERVSASGSVVVVDQRGQTYEARRVN